MRRSNRARWYWFLVLVVGFGPFLAACNPVSPPPRSATEGKPLIEAVEAYMADLPGSSPKLFLTTEVRDRNGFLMGEFVDEGRRYWMPLNRIAPYVQQAIVATEDKTFYTNPGVDWVAIARAVIVNSQSGDAFSGASTITQQLARNIAFPYEKRIERSLDRKVSETWLAEDLTARFSKVQILEMYLNVVAFGHQAYGIEAAARTYFAKSAADLTLAESALLAALPQAPADLDPLVPSNRDAAKARQGLVLALMAKNGDITEEQAQAAYNQPLNYVSLQVPAVAPYFMDYLRQSLDAEYGPSTAGRLGLTITTTLDLRVQQLAEAIVKKQVDALRKPYNLSNAALVALKPGTGEILAMVGGAEYSDKAKGGLVNVTVRDRQPGSAIKPVLYSLAFSRGLSPADVIWDIPTDFPLTRVTSYRPQNYDSRFHGPVRLRTALANSYNVPAVKLLYRMGIPDMIGMAHKMGITGLNGPANQYGLSLTLGGGEVTLLDLTDAYATIASGGLHAAPTPLHEVRDSAGRASGAPRRAPDPVLDPRVAYMVTSILSDNVARTPMFGPNSPLHLTQPAAAKTGTTTDWRDNWTVGYTPYLVVGVWAGNNDGTPMRNISGITGAAPIWHDFMEALFARPELQAAVRGPNEPRNFPRPAGLVDAPICVLSSLRGGTNCSKYSTELFIDPAHPLTTTVTTQKPAAATIGAQAAVTATATSTITAASAVAKKTIMIPLIVGDQAATPTTADARPISPTVPAPRPVDPGWTIRQVVWTARGLCVTDQGGTTRAVIRVPPGDPKEAARVWSWATATGTPADPPSCRTGTLTDFLPPTPIAPPVTEVAQATGPIQTDSVAQPTPQNDSGPAASAPPSTPAGAPVDTAASPATHAPVVDVGVATIDIAYPSVGATVNGSIQVVGSVLFNTQDAQFYKVEYGYGANPDTWITMGSGHANPVSNGGLETWHADALPSGNYALRVVIVKRDGNYLVGPTVPVYVEH
jgi:1A family penicillin-binding protein